MSLLEEYYRKIEEKTISLDPVQEKAVQFLQEAAQELENLTARSSKPAKSENRGLFGFFARSEVQESVPILKGVYLWGGVGRGKTWLMDLFYKTVDIEDKQRYHFHHFMEMLHKAIKDHPDQEDPLEVIAKEMAKKMRLLCLDELHLTEIANARLLLPVLQYLIEAGVLLVTTSNRHPKEVYQGNLKKQLFIPYTDFLQKHMYVMHLDSDRDYRTLEAEQQYGDHPQLKTLNPDQLDTCFENLSRGSVQHDKLFTINHRQVPILRASENVIWLDFAVACEGTRTTSDYIWMTDRYEVVMLSDVYIMTEEHEPTARRFFNLVDELYDRKVRLLFSADTTLDQLYQGYRLQFAFKRTLSRLTAMHTANRLNCDLDLD